MSHINAENAGAGLLAGLLIVSAAAAANLDARLIWETGGAPDDADRYAPAAANTLPAGAWIQLSQLRFPGRA